MEVCPGQTTNEEPTGDYRYEGLARNTIRVFRIRQANNIDDEVCGELVNIDLVQNGGPPSYNALSHCWGPTFSDGCHLAETIVCNGKTLRITPELKSALRHIRTYGYRENANVIEMRESSRLDRAACVYKNNAQTYRHLVSRPLWIDAICINQRDLQERAHHVAMMAAIYRGSMGVIVWLGEADESLQYFFSLRSEHSPPLIHARHATPRRRHGRLREMCHVSPPLPPILDRDAAFKELLAHPWFRRRWVLLKMAHARECDFLIGNFICSRLQMRALIEKHAPTANVLALQLANEVKLGILETCWRFDDSECSDPRDLLFALRSMASDGSKIRIDYSASVRDVYWQMVDTTGIYRSRPETTLQILQVLAIATCKRRTPGPDGRFEIETWVPDLRIRNTYVSEYHCQAVESCMPSSPIRGAFGTRQNLGVSCEISGDDSGWRYLRIWGILLRDARRKSIRATSGLPQSPNNKTLEMQSSSDESALRSKMPYPECESDHIWVAQSWSCQSSASVSHSSAATKNTIISVSGVLGFVLRGGSTRSTHHGSPVYTLHSCSVIEGSVIPHALQEKQQQVHGFDISHGTKFYLE